MLCRDISMNRRLPADWKTSRSPATRGSIKWERTGAYQYQELGPGRWTEGCGGVSAMALRALRPKEGRIPNPWVINYFLIVLTNLLIGIVSGDGGVIDGSLGLQDRLSRALVWIRGSQRVLSRLTRSSQQSATSETLLVTYRSFAPRILNNNIYHFYIYNF